MREEARLIIAAAEEEAAAIRERAESFALESREQLIERAGTALSSGIHYFWKRMELRYQRSRVWSGICCGCQ